MSEVLVARGGLRNARVSLLSFPVFFGAVTASFGLMAGVFQRPFSAGAVGEFILAGAAFGLAAGAIGMLLIAALLLASAARVKYYVRGAKIVVRRGRRQVAILDATHATRIWRTGNATTRSLLFGIGQVWSVHGDLPCISYTTEETGQADTERQLPRVLVVGQGVEEFAAAVYRELTRNGVSESRLG